MVDMHRADPIVIHGILPRSGTNYLWDLLLLHPDCARAREPVNEDLFLEQSDLLVSFAERVRASWHPIWGDFPADLTEHLCAGIGEGLLSFLWTNRERRLLTKSPSVRHLDRFFTFFPSARLVILVRDGRSVAQSAMDTFGWSFDRACREWSAAAQTIHHFQQEQSGHPDRWRLLRYEDLVDEPEGQLRSLFEFLDLDADRYDFQAARSLPVRGSSAFGRKAGKVHWETVAKEASFSPKERWRSWPAHRLERFQWVAGEWLDYFGYPDSRRRFSSAASVRHTLRDWRWQAATSANRLVYRTRGRLALRTRLARTLRAFATTDGASRIV
jgi:protein-tyrosine sulfotransferase